jgi:hypothetical protein
LASVVVSTGQHERVTSTFGTILGLCVAENIIRPVRYSQQTMHICSVFIQPHFENTGPLGAYLTIISSLSFSDPQARYLRITFHLIILKFACCCLAPSIHSIRYHWSSHIKKK